MLAHDGKLWVIGGMMGDHGTLQDVWSTTDGASWTQVTNSAPVAAVPAAFEFAGRVWARGSDDHLWNTTDGANWTQAPTGAPMGNQVACNGKIWVFETQDPRRMWWSQDGITWTQLPGQSPFGPRSGSAITVFDNKIWVICGDYFPDVWYFIEQEPAFGFTAQPRGGWAEEGAPWLLTAGTTGTLGPVTYQWLRDSYYMPGATDAAYNIPSLTPDDAGWYTCVVTDNNGLHVPDPVHIDVFPAGSLPADRGEGLFTVIASILLAFRVLARRHWG
jgi:hypothetical protein